jgi:hypothetical protein
MILGLWIRKKWMALWQTTGSWYRVFRGGFSMQCCLCSERGVCNVAV